MNFTSLHERGPSGVEALVGMAASLKKNPRSDRPLSGMSVGLCFMNPSLRTQTSMEVAAASLGAHPVTLHAGAGTWALECREGVVMDGDKPEHAKEAVRVLSRYCQALGVRCFPTGKTWEEDRQDPMLAAFARYATVPVISLESAMGHPLQALADLLTIREKRPKARKFLLTWAPHVKALPVAVPHSAAEAASLGGMDVTVLRPYGWDLDHEVMARVEAACRAHGRTLTVTSDAAAAYAGADVVYAKNWGSLLRYNEAPPRDRGFHDLWRVTPEKMARTEDAIFMHCLPVRRGVVVDDAVLDSPASVVIDQAENRLHTAKAVLLSVLEKRS